MLKRIHSYLPSKGEGGDQHFVSTNVIGDQLTVDRAVNSLMINGAAKWLYRRGENDRFKHRNCRLACRHEFFTGNYNGHFLYCISYGSHNTLEHLIYQNIYMMRVKNDHRSKFSNLSNWKEEA